MIARGSSIAVSTLMMLTLGTASARAADIAGSSVFAPAQGPVIAAGQLVFVPSQQVASNSVQIRGAAGGQTHLLATLPGEPARTDGGSFTDRSASASVAASADVLAATVTTRLTLGDGRSGDPGQFLRRTWAGRLGQPMTARSAPCRSPSALEFPAVLGDQVVSQGADCGALGILNLGDGTRRELPGATSQAALSDPFVAYLQAYGTAGPGALVVADATGHEVLRVPLATARGDVRFTVDRSGTVALLGHVDTAHPNSVALAIASPAQPIPRVLTPRDHSTISGARLAEGRLALLRVPRGANPVTGACRRVVARRLRRRACLHNRSGRS